MVVTLKNKYLIVFLFFCSNFTLLSQSQFGPNPLKKDSANYFFSDASFIKDLDSNSVYFDSLKVYINPPLHFKKVDTMITGFIHVGANASIILAKTTPILLAVAPFYDSTSFASQNETLVYKDTLTLNNNSFGFMFVLQFVHQDVEVERIMLVTGNQKESFVATATYPKSVHNLLFPVFIESFKTIKLED